MSVDGARVDTAAHDELAVLGQHAGSRRGTRAVIALSACPTAPVQRSRRPRRDASPVGGQDVARGGVETPTAAIRRIFMCQISVSDIARRELPDSNYKRTISSIVDGRTWRSDTALVDAAAYITL
jgi:hypothetical protein